MLFIPLRPSERHNMVEMEARKGVKKMLIVL